MTRPEDSGHNPQNPEQGWGHEQGGYGQGGYGQGGHGQGHPGEDATRQFGSPGGYPDDQGQTTQFGHQGQYGQTGQYGQQDQTAQFGQGGYGQTGQYGQDPQYGQGQYGQGQYGQTGQFPQGGYGQPGQYGQGPGGPGGPQGPGGPGSPGGSGGNKKGLFIGLAVVGALLVIALIAGLAYALTGGDSDDDQQAAAPTTSAQAGDPSSDQDSSGATSDTDPEGDGPGFKIPGGPAGSGSSPSSSASSGSPHQVSLEVEGSGVDKASVIYTGENDEVKTEQDHPLPFSLQYEVPGGKSDYLSVSAMSFAFGTDTPADRKVSCRIKVDGQVVSENDGSGSAATAHCSHSLR